MMLGFDVGLLLIRLTIGFIVAAHGAQKVFGWFGGHGINGTTKMMEGLHLQPARLWGWVSALNEFVGGVLTALGWLMPIGPLLIIANMLVAISLVHWNKGFWNTKGGYEYPLVLSAMALGIALTGAGIFSVDAMFGFVLPEPLTLAGGLAIVLIGWLIVLTIAHRVPLTRPAPAHRT